MTFNYNVLKSYHQVNGKFDENMIKLQSDAIVSREREKERERQSERFNDSENAKECFW